MWKRALTVAPSFMSYAPVGNASASKSKWTSRNLKRFWRTTQTTHDFCRTECFALFQFLGGFLRGWQSMAANLSTFEHAAQASVQVLSRHLLALRAQGRHFGHG